MPYADTNTIFKVGQQIEFIWDTHGEEFGSTSTSLIYNVLKPFSLQEMYDGYVAAAALSDDSADEEGLANWLAEQGYLADANCLFVDISGWFER